MFLNLCLFSDDYWVFFFTFFCFQWVSFILMYLFLNQEMAAGLKSELTNRLLALNVSNFSMMPVKVGCDSRGVDLRLLCHFWKSFFLTCYFNQYGSILPSIFSLLFDFSETMLLNVLIYLEGNNMSLRSIIHSRYFSLYAWSFCVFD